MSREHSHAQRKRDLIKRLLLALEQHGLKDNWRWPSAQPSDETTFIILIDEHPFEVRVTALRGL